MKKILVSILLFFISISLSIAQSDTSRKAKFFIKAELYPGFYKFPNNTDYSLSIGSGIKYKHFSFGLLFSHIPRNAKGYWIISSFNFPLVTITGGIASQGGVFAEFSNPINKNFYIIESAQLLYGYAKYFTTNSTATFDYITFSIGNGIGFKKGKMSYELFPLCLTTINYNYNSDTYNKINLSIKYNL